MESLKELYRIGPGPSSSHTVAPMNACLLFKKQVPEALYFDAELFGSLALTGQGHATDTIIRETFMPRLCRVSFNPYRKESFPNGVVLRAFDEYNQELLKWTVFSLGGGAIEVEEVNLHLHDEVYPHNSLEEITAYCRDNNLSLAEYCFKFDSGIEDYLEGVVKQMLKTVRNGLENKGLLPGALKIERIAGSLLLRAQLCNDKELRNRLLLTAYAYAACEENASGHTCVTAPTMGASGILAAIVYHYYLNLGISKTKLIECLAVAGIYGNVIKKNATISGAVGGCQAEVGTACAMASAMIAYLNGCNIHTISYAAEIGIEHNLGLTCDPVGGYVIIPCIERNAVATLRAFDNAFIAENVGAIKENRVSFDNVVKTMNYTGKKIAMELRETSLGGLAAEIKVPETQETIKEKQASLFDETEPNETVETVLKEVTVENEAETEDVSKETVEEIEEIEETAEVEEATAVEVNEEMEEVSFEREEIKETVKEEKKEEEGYHLTDFDFALLDSWNKKPSKDSKEKDAFSDKLDFLNDK